MELQKGLCCSACNPVRHWSEFIKIFDRGDVGITIYRYRGPAHYEMGRTNKRPKETFIFYTTKVTERRHGIDIYTAERWFHCYQNFSCMMGTMRNGAKCMNYCSRCIEMMRRIETLFGNPPSDREAELCEIFSCPPCADLAHKFRKFSAEDNLLIREHDSELIHLQRLTSPSQDTIGTARTRFEDLVMFVATYNVPAKQERAKDNEVTKKERAEDNELTKKEREEDSKITKKEREKDNKLTKKESDKNNELTKKETAKDLNTTTTKIPKLPDKPSKDAAEGTVKDKGRNKKERDADDKDLKAKSTQAQKSLGKISKDVTKTIKGGDKMVSSSKVGNIDSKNEKTGKTPKPIFESKIATATKEPPIKSKSVTKLASQSVEKNRLTRMKIADPINKQAKEDKAHPNKSLQLLKQKKDIEDKLNCANKLEEEAKNARARAEGQEGPGNGSEDRETDVCSDEALTVVDCMIKGNKIVKASAVEQVEKPIAAAVLPSTTSRSGQPARPPNTDSTTPVHGSRSRKLRDARVSYNLSERKYVDKGWTLLPKEMVMRKVTLFLMHPARNEFDWMEINRHKERVMYESGEQLATFDENGCARVYYRSGVLALDLYQAQEKNAGGYRVVVYSNGKPSERGRPPSHAVLATFDYSGNGAVFDHIGRPRLKYSQNDGVVLDRSIGPYTHWKWHNLNDACRLQTVLVENEPMHKDPQIIRLGEEEVLEDPPGKRGKKVRNASQGDDKSSDKKSNQSRSRGSDKSTNPGQEIELDEPISNDEMIMRTIESENVIKENCRLSKGFSLYQIKMKAFKINDNFSLRIMDQSSVFLTFSDGRTRLRTNVGMVMDPTVVLGQDLVEVGEVTSSLEKVPASESLVELQRVVRGARAVERARLLRENKLNPPVSSGPPLPSSVKARSHKH